MGATKTATVKCINPNTGGSMNIDKGIYELFSKAIYHTVKTGKRLTYTEIVEGVKNCFIKQKTQFDGSVNWYVVTIKNDLQAKGVLKVFSEKGKKLHSIA